MSSQLPQNVQHVVPRVVPPITTGLLLLAVALGQFDRDALLFERMKPIFEAEDAVAFIGFPHFPGVGQLFLDEGYRVSQGVA